MKNYWMEVIQIKRRVDWILWNKRISDMPEVVVSGNMDGAIRGLKRRIGLLKTFSELKRRRDHPGIMMRRRDKKRKAFERTLRMAKKRKEKK